MPEEVLQNPADIPQASPIPVAEPEKSESLSGELASNYSVQELRVIKDRGFYGNLVPINFTIPVPTSYWGGDNPIYPYQCPFFIANRTYQIMQISVRYQVKGTDAGGCTLTVKKAASGVAYTSATAVMTGSFNIGTTGTNNTVVTITKNTATNYINSDSSSRLIEGDSLLCTMTNVNTGVHNVCISVVLKSL